MAQLKLDVMALIVQKFGGSSVGDAERIRAVADHVARTRAAGNDVVVVVSAMAGTSGRSGIRFGSATPSAINFPA